MKLLAALVLVIAACSDGKTNEPRREPERQRRVIEPPPRGPRALPPHAIRAEGVGPYKLGATVTALLDELPSGPRITQFTLPGVIQRDILRAEEDAILIGAEPQGKATFVSVIRSEIARTESGVHVGSTREEVVKALGSPIEVPDRALDPRVVIPEKLPNARVVFESDRENARVVAIVLVAEAERSKDAKDGKEQKPSTEVLPTSDDELTVVSRETKKPVAPSVRVPNLVYGAVLRNPSDGREDVVAIVKSTDPQSVTWSLVSYRLHEGKLVRFPEPKVLYPMTASNARWIGAEIEDLELYLELTSRADSIEVGGLLATRVAGNIRDIVVISPVSVPRPRAKPVTHEPTDAGTSDAEAGAAHSQ